MKVILLALFLSVTIARADFINDQYTDYPDVLLRIVTSAENDSHFKSYTEPGDIGPMARYLKEAEYIGPLDASFGTVHVAQLFYIRSSDRGSKHDRSRGHDYIVFLDDDFKIRDYWLLDLPDDSLYVDGAKLMSDKTVVMDYAKLPQNGTVLFDGKVMGGPKWDKNKATGKTHDARPD